MRALVFFLSLVFVFVAFLKFYGDPEVAAEGPEGAPAGVGAAPVDSEEEGPSAGEGESSPPARFLEPPADAAAGAPAPAVSRGEAASAGSQDEEEAIPDWLRGVELAPVQDGQELLLAATLVHGTPEDVALCAAAGPPERGLMAEAFSRAVHGDPRSARSLALELPEDSLSVRELGLLRSALGGDAGTTTPASARVEGPMVLAMEMCLLENEAERALLERRHAEVARGYSELILAELDAPWPAEHATLARYTARLDQAQKHHRWSRKGEWSSVEVEVADGDNLVAIRKRYLTGAPGEVICTGLIEASNQIPKNSVIHKGQLLRIPTDRVRMLVDLSARWCVYLLGDEVAGSWPVGIGRPGEETPPGEYTVGDKSENPAWSRIGKPIIPFGDPRNPLGTRWMGWFRDGFKTSYGFHGTSEPESVGQASSDGCIRLLRDDVERMFDILPIGARVIVRE